MRSFSDWDKNVLNNLVKEKTGSSHQVDTLLNSFYFKEDLGRALIIQAQRKYAVFFLKSELYENEQTKNEELTKFLDLLSLLKLLVADGYLAIHKADNEKDKSMFFLQDSFTNPQPSSGTIYLNAAGDYTSSPETIHNKNKQVAYKGIVFEREMYDLILGLTTGNYIITQNINQLLTTSQTKYSWKGKGTFLSVLLLIALLSLAIQLYINTGNQHEEQYQQHQSVVESHHAIQQQLNDLTNKIQFISTHLSSASLAQQSTENKVRKHYGIDVSRWNGDIQSELDKVDSIDFVICKATEGKSGVDPTFKANWNLLSEKGLIRGAYHFYLVDDDPIRQAEHFWSIIQQLDSTDLAPVVDIEQGSISSDTDPVRIQVELLLFLRHLQSKCNRLPMIYTGVDFADQYLTNDAFASYPLWLADYTKRENPSIPKAWKEKGFTIWQRTDEYTINSNNTDLDIFYGKLEQLYKDDPLKMNQHNY